MNFNSVNLNSLQAQELSTPLVAPISLISRSQRWMVSRRLNQLNISSRCPSDGSLWVEVDNSFQAILIRAVVLEMVATKREKINWLDRCWESTVSYICSD